MERNVAVIHKKGRPAVQFRFRGAANTVAAGRTAPEGFETRRVGPLGCGQTDYQSIVLGYVPGHNVTDLAAMSATHSKTGVVGIMVAVAARSGTHDVKERLPADAGSGTRFSRCETPSAA
jgi:hypothetical protein